MDEAETLEKSGCMRAPKRIRPWHKCLSLHLTMNRNPEQGLDAGLPQKNAERAILIHELGYPISMKQESWGRVGAGPSTIQAWHETSYFPPDQDQEP
jgi:hypothetical protein